MNPKKTDKFATGVIYTMSGLIVLILIFLLSYILIQGLPHVSWHFLTSPAKVFEAGGGISVQLFNSFYLLILSMIFSLPIAILAGIYLAEYAPQNKITAMIHTAIEILSSLPSIVVGLFGFLVFSIQMGFGFSILSGALALTVFNLPLLTRNVEESLQSIPFMQREAGMALGLSRWETVLHVIMPEAVPNLLTGIILASGRVFGEAAALIYTAGQSSPTLDFTNWNPLYLNSPLNPMRPAETLAVHIWKVNGEGIIPDLNAVSAASSAVLIIAVLFFNLAARYFGKKLYARLTGSN